MTDQRLSSVVILTGASLWWLIAPPGADMRLLPFYIYSVLFRASLGGGGDTMRMPGFDCYTLFNIHPSMF